MLNKFMLAAAVLMAVASFAPVYAQRGGVSPADHVRAAETVRRVSAL
jgi:hypothetical protein